MAENKGVLIPEEGGWLSYRTAPVKLNLGYDEVKCNQAKLDINDLKKKLATGNYGALLYQNPGGYFAQQQMRTIYNLCKKNACLVILDVSGSIGTDLCDGNFADFLVGSFGKWKLVEARMGGFISCKKYGLWKNLDLKKFDDEDKLLVILQKLEELSARIRYLQNIRDKIINDISGLGFCSKIVHPQDLGFVLVVKYNNISEKEKIINYCKNNELEWTQCPRYIRLNEEAISIEIKRL